MKVSFLVTFYNQKEYVKQSLDSILEIDKPCDWEIIVGDDGSSDGTVEEVNKYVECYPNNIYLHVMPRELGVKYDSVRRASANRLSILEKSTGDFFCMLDGDDFYCDTGFVTDAINIFKSCHNISIVAYGYVYYKDGMFGENKVLPIGTNGHMDRKMYIQSNYIHAGACVHRKCFGQERIDYIKELGYFDDNNIVMNSLNYGDMYAFTRSIYAYRQTGCSIYTSMDILEQAVLNVQGMDVDLKLVDEKWTELIKKRYACSVVYMYVWKNEINNILGEEKRKKYLSGCRSLKPSYCESLLSLDGLNYELLREIRKMMICNVAFYVKQYIKHFLRGILR